MKRVKNFNCESKLNDELKFGNVQNKRAKRAKKSYGEFFEILGQKSNKKKSLLYTQLISTISELCGRKRKEIMIDNRGRGGGCVSLI